MESNCWIQTYSGLKFYPFAPEITAISIIDIAHALSNTCRFTGHVRYFYSVAQHCVLASEYAKNPETALYALLHDASEAYICDIAKPIKITAAFKEYRALEKKLQQVIYKKYGLSDKEPAELHEIDCRMLATEKRDLLNHNMDWGFKITPYQKKIDPWSPSKAKSAFLLTFKNLYQNITI